MAMTEETRAGTHGPGRPEVEPAVSGICARLAARLGLGVGLLRVLAILLALSGFALAAAFAVFDHRLFGGQPAPGALRLAAIALGLVATFAYPALALLRRGERGRWDFGSSLGLVLLLVLVGQALGVLLEPYWDAAKGAWQTSGAAGWFSWPAEYVEQQGIGAKDGILGLFLVSSSAFLWLQRRTAYRFLRAMHTGVVLVVLTTLAITLGVLVPQIDGFEDPDVRVDLARERADYRLVEERGLLTLPRDLEDGHEQYMAFRWAEGYFLHHLLHLYGIGMPEGVITPAMEEGLERFGRRYGFEESENRRKGMLAAMGGQETTREIGAFIRRHEDELWRFFEVATVLQLNRTYKSHWFAALLTLLFVAVFFNTYKGSPRQWLSVQKVGFFIVHNGILILLLGGGLSKLLTDRGILNLFLDAPPRDTYLRHYDPAKKARLPFHVRLDRFARQDWKALEVVFREGGFSSMTPSYTLWEGRTIDLDYAQDEDGEWRPGLRLGVKKLHERTRVGEPLVREGPADAADGIPLAELRASHRRVPDDAPGEDTGGRVFVTPVLPPSACFLDPRGGFRLATAFGGEPVEDLFPAREGILGALHASFPARGEAADEHLVAELGRTFEVGGFRVTLVGGTADFRRESADERGSSHPSPLAEQPYRFAAVWVDIEPLGGGEVERRLVLESIDPVQQRLQPTYAHGEIVLRLDWDPWLAPGPPRFLLHWTEEGPPRLVTQGGEAQVVRRGERLDLPGDNDVLLVDVYRHAVEKRNLEYLPSLVGDDGWDEDFYSPMPKGLELEVVHFPGTSREVSKKIKMATTEEGRSNLWFSDDGRFYLRFFENSQMLPFEWRSVLSILERDGQGRLREVPLGSDAEREIRVNDYFHHKGYRFFQTNADASMPTYSGIGVVYDPGIPIVLLGMYTIIAGTVVAFIVRPIVLAARKGNR